MGCLLIYESFLSLAASCGVMFPQCSIKLNVRLPPESGRPTHITDTNDTGYA
jgi:hypothetical protein